MILIVDDEKEITDVIYGLLQEIDPTINMVKITDPNSVMNIVENNKVQLIILDIVMPKKNGLELLKEVRGINNCPVVITSAISSIMENEISNFSNVEVLEKPFDTDRLEEIFKSSFPPPL